MLQNYKDLVVWQKSVELSIKIYEATKSFPKEEMFGLVSQIRRSAVSIPSNIAEGRCRGSRKDFVQFLRIAYGSCAELQTQLKIAHKLSFIDLQHYSELEILSEEICKMLRSMISKLSISKP